MEGIVRHNDNRFEPGTIVAVGASCFSGPPQFNDCAPAYPGCHQVVCACDWASTVNELAVVTPEWTSHLLDRNP